MSKASLLITGATGFIGSRLAEIALEQGYGVRTLARREWSGRPAVPVQERWLGELPYQIPEEAFDGVDAVAHCAVSLSESLGVSRAVNVHGTLRLADKLRDGTFVFLSSQSAKPDALSVYGKTKYEAEQELAKRGNAVILRPGLVVGPGERGMFSNMARMVERLPVLPLLGGGRGIVQPIHVDDLCVAILRCVEDRRRGETLCLGDPDGVPLSHFLQEISLARRGRRRMTVSIPLWPVEMALGAAEAIGLRLPIRSGSVKALRVVERMPTADDLGRVGVELRPLREALAGELSASPLKLAKSDRSVRVLLIGAGKIGFLHAATLSRLPGVVLCGLVDPKPGATGMLLGMGVVAPVFRDLEQAIRETRPNAAVVATPTASHAELTRRCAEAGLAVLIEKPLAVRRQQLDDYAAIAEAHPEVPIQVGYLAARFPHFTAALGRLQAGAYGTIRGFSGFTLLSLIKSGSTDRWEVRKEISGGGSYINSGVHVLSMIRQAFGDPVAIDAQAAAIVSREVEDSMVVEMRYPSFSGWHYCSWTIDDYPRQENRLVIFTDRGQLVSTNQMSLFVPDEGAAEVLHDLDFDLGFNVLPDYCGGGMAVELAELREAARVGDEAAVDLGAASALETLVFDVYDKVREVESFEAAAEDVGEGERWAPADPTSCLLDLRHSDLSQVGRSLADGPSRWAGYQLLPQQIGQARQVLPAGELRVTVPDFASQSRALAAGRYVEVLTAMGALGSFAAGWRALRVLPREKGVTFWVVASALLAAALSRVPAKFEGTVLLHSYLVDFALTPQRLDMLELLLAACRRACPKAQVGFHTHLAAEAFNALHLMMVDVDEISVLASPAMRDASKLESTQDLRVTAEVGTAPAAAHRAAAADPAAWCHGAEALLVGPAADPRLDADEARALAKRWARVFPGIEPPGAVL